MNNKVLFLIIGNEVKYLQDSTMDHKEWYVSLGFDPSTFDSVVRGFILDNKMIELELAYSDNKFKELEINKKVDLYKYLVGVSYKDDNGWMPIYDDNLTIYLTRINKDYFNIDFKINYTDFDEKINIKMNDDLKLF